MTFFSVATARRARSQPCVGHTAGQNGYSLTTRTVQTCTCRHTSRAGPSPRHAQPRDGTAPRPRHGSPARPCAAPAAPTARVASWQPGRAAGAAAHARCGGQRRQHLAPPAARSSPQREAHARARREARLPHSRRRRAARAGRARARAKSSRRVRETGVESWADFQKMMVLQPRTAGSTSQPSRVK